MSSTYVIAEVGSTHEGSPHAAQRLIETAAQCGADAVKWQWLSSAKRLCERRNAPEYYASYALLETRPSLLSNLASACAHAGLDFLCTAYLPEDVPVVAEHVKGLKIASFEAAAPDILAAMHRLPTPFLPLYVSTGMLDEDEACALAQTLDSFPLTLLHCVSAYPCPLKDLNLGAARRLFARLQATRTAHRVGVSDHAAVHYTQTGALSVAAGAEVIEFHLRLNETSENNRDYAVALSPAAAQAYVGNIRIADVVVGEGRKRLLPVEHAMARYRAAAR